MSLLHIQQIKNYLLKMFDGLIDVSDYSKASSGLRESAFLTRALAAFSVMYLADLDAAPAANCVTDGTGDNGIDAVYHDRGEKLLYLVQAKWQGDGHGSLERGDTQKFITGFRDLVNARFDRFNKKLRVKETEIEEAIYDAQTRIILVAIYTGQDALAAEPQRDFDDLLREMNDPTDVVMLRVLRQVNIHGVIATGVKGAPVNLEVALSDWGQTREPYQSVYGQVSASDVANWWNAHHPRLLAPNLRVFLGSTDVNEGIIDTLRNAPEHFWYFNNGITALCARIDKKPLGGNTRESGIFECSDVTIVNGAQTVGAIAAANASYPSEVAKAKVTVRFISLENCPEDFGTAITRFTNTQNRIERRDFVALDPEQERIRTELQIDGVEYAYKSGDTVTPNRIGFDLPEATVALACSQPDVTYAVQAKREIGKLWEDIGRPPYRILFNAGLTGAHLWSLVRVLRDIDTVLQREQRAREGRERQFAVHGNRFVAWIVYQSLGSLDGLKPESVQQVAAGSLDRLIASANRLYPDAYLASLFKNATKCKNLAVDIGFI